MITEGFKGKAFISPHDFTKAEIETLLGLDNQLRGDYTRRYKDWIAGEKRMKLA